MRTKQKVLCVYMVNKFNMLKAHKITPKGEGESCAPFPSPIGFWVKKMDLKNAFSRSGKNWRYEMIPLIDAVFTLTS